VFCPMGNGRYGDHPELEPIASFMEAEGLTLVIPKHRADAYGIPYGAVFKCITLSVHSSLEAVGLTAVIATKLAEHNISANVIAAFYHDHVFVQNGRAEEALAALEELAHG
ncbi:MAG: ACT domain-containing protein, partial [Anaerolineales bacterium]|nr:ACT domain-containing protein [Anaerolineales bacterium]